MKVRLLTIVFVMFSFSALFAQTKTVRNVVGKCELSRHITLEQAEKKALQEAKSEALRKAGVAENVWSAFGLITQNDGQEFQEVYSEMSVMAVGGLVNVLKKPTYSIEDNPIDGKRYAVATIDAEVKTGERIDKTYKIDVKGLASVFKDDETFSFKVDIYGANSYLKIFWFDADGGSIFFPMQGYDQNSIFQKGNSYTFPINTSIEYVMSKKNPKNDFERVNIMVVATKKDYPFLDKEVTFESLLRWIYDIPANDRCTFYQAVMVK